MTTNKQESQNRNDELIHLYPPHIIASLLAALLRNAPEPNKKFERFEDQLDATCTLAADIVRRRPGSQSATNFQSAANALKKEFDDSQKIRDLFETAHVSIMHLINALAATGRWEPCGFVAHQRIEQIVSLGD